MKKKPWPLAAALLVLAAAAALAATITGTNGTFTTTVTAATATARSKITTTYTPRAANPACASIYMTQTCRDVDQSGNLVKPKDFKTKAFEHLQDDMTTGGTYVDHVACEKDPYYNGEDAGKDVKSQGTNNGTAATPTTMSDAPSYSDGIFPTGVTRITSTFEVCAICKDDGRILDCFTWTYTRTKGDGTGGTIASGTTASTGSQEFKDAKKKFETNHKSGTTCPETVAETNPGAKNAASGGGKKTPAAPAPDTPFQLSWDIVNTGGSDLFDLEYAILVDGLLLDAGTVTTIPYFDSATVTVEVPGLPLGPHTVMVSIDPANLVPEYDETDNLAFEEFEISPVSPAPDGPETGGNVLRLLQPNPTAGQFRVMLRMGADSPARLSVVDLRGRVVHSRTIPGGRDTWRTEEFRLQDHLGAGVYFLRLEQAGTVESRKFILLK